MADNKNTRGGQTSRSSRKAAEKRAKKRAQGRPPLADLNTSSDATVTATQERPSLRVLADKPKDGETKYPGTRFVALSLLAFVTAMATVQMGGPVLGHTWQIQWLLPGLILTFLAVWWAWWASGWVTLRQGIVTASILGLLLVLFTYAAVTSVVIDGKPVLASSDTARAYQTSQEMLEDLDIMAEYDRLLSYEPADARVHFEEYGPAMFQLEEISAKYANTGSWVSARFGTTGDLIQSAAHFGALALDSKSRLIESPDAALEADLTNLRSQFVAAWTQSGDMLRESSSEFGFDPGPAGQGVQE